MKKTYFAPEIEITKIACAPLLSGSITGFEGITDEIDLGGESDGGLEAESNMFDFFDGDDGSDNFAF